MSFRITPEDVGRVAKARDGKGVVIIEYDDHFRQPVKANSNGEVSFYTPLGQFYATHKSARDLIAWADEPAPDQVADQPRPKDLRDEFAMVALSGITANARWFLPTNPPSDINAEYAEKAYAIADAMLKARGK